MKKILFLVLALGAYANVFGSEEHATFEQARRAAFGRLERDVDTLCRLSREGRTAELSTQLDTLSLRYPGIAFVDCMGPDVGRQKSLLTIAIEHGNVETVRMLLTRGARIDVWGAENPCIQGNVIRLNCSIQTNPSIAPVLIEHMRRLRESPPFGFRSFSEFLHILAWQIIDKEAAKSIRSNDTVKLNGYTQLLIYLLNQREIVMNTLDCSEMLHAAARVGYVEAVQLLIIKGARVDVRDGNGRTAEMAAELCPDEARKNAIKGIFKGTQGTHVWPVLHEAYNGAIPENLTNMILEIAGLEPRRPEVVETSFMQKLIDFARSFSFFQ